MLDFVGLAHDRYSLGKGLDRKGEGIFAVDRLPVSLQQFCHEDGKFTVISVEVGSESSLLSP